MQLTSETAKALETQPDAATSLLGLCCRLLDLSALAVLQSKALEPLMEVAARFAASVQHPTLCRAALAWVAAVAEWSNSLASSAARSECTCWLQRWLAEDAAGQQLLSVVLNGCVEGPAILVDAYHSLLHKVGHPNERCTIDSAPCGSCLARSTLLLLCLTFSRS